MRMFGYGVCMVYMIQICLAAQFEVFGLVLCGARLLFLTNRAILGSLHGGRCLSVALCLGMIFLWMF